MADEEQTLRNISWNEIFGFSHIFKSFKMAIHPSKLLLALLAIALTWALGLYVMDPIWSGASDSNRVQKNEAWRLWTAPSRAALLDGKDRWLHEQRVDSLETLAGQFQDSVKLEKPVKEDFDEALAAVDEGITAAYEKALEAAEKSWSTEKDLIKQLPEEQQEARKEKAKAALLTAKQTALRRYVAAKAKLREIRGGRIFASFLDWQGYCLSNAVTAVRRARFTAGLTLLYYQRGSKTPDPYRFPGQTNRPAFVEAGTAVSSPESYGLLAWLLMMAWGVWWMFCAYPFYTIIYVAVALAVWAVLGGAICRIAALHAAREEKISIVSAVRFGLSKFFSLFGAPLLPLAFIVGLGFCLAIAGWIGAIPYAGEWLFVLLFMLPLIAGVISTFLTIGLAGGFPLMWPTIAAEGSDGFDAFSRSFSYIFARPFRYGLYWLVATIYGTICYLFVRLFAFMSLRTVHHWAGWWMRAAGRDEYALGAGKLDTMWAQPTFSSFHGPIQWEAMRNGSEAAASVILGLWVYLVSGVVLAFLACFIFSAATNIYFLLRRQVDATDLDDVYIEEPEEAFPPGEAPEPTEEAPAAPEEPSATAEGESEETPPAKEPPAQKEPGAEPPEEDKPE